jgi:hypothetical protein
MRLKSDTVNRTSEKHISLNEILQQLLKASESFPQKSMEIQRLNEAR